MERRVILVVLVLATVLPALGQKYKAEKGYASFFSKATVEDIKAENTQISSLFNAASGDIAFSIPIKGFQFDKALMQEHFNEKYMETEKYPTATFAGKLQGYSSGGAATQSVTAKGKLNIHGVVRPVEIAGQVEKQGDKLLMKSSFVVKLADYNVQIPKLLWQNIAEQVDVTIQVTYKPQ
ncbi:YceI family protein [Dawidia soli]|uniref:YceI family protein n=1 Tax=Dawidia soli TaxID=2782352 RepID=A0AAP2GGW6_9BACT|nr:YceI family protein [Dawidia soli]MBT1685910.1 YceI family protein [Dawidia soli]